MTLQSSQRLPELLFYTKKSYRILQLQLQLQSYKSIHIQPTHAHYTPENSPSRIQFYMQKTKSSSSTTTTFQRAKETFIPEKNSMHRRQGDLLEMHPCVTRTFQAFQPQDLPKALQLLQTFQSFQTFQTFRSFQSFQTLQLLQLLQRHSGHSSHSWPSSLSRQFYIFYSSIGFQKTPPSTSWAITLQTFLQTLHSSKKGRCCDIGQTCIGRCQDDIFPRIELNPSFVLSSDNTNCKNDIQLFHQLFDEHRVNRDYH